MGKGSAAPASGLACPYPTGSRERQLRAHQRSGHRHQRPVRPRDRARAFPCLGRPRPLDGHPPSGARSSNGEHVVYVLHQIA
eukprot:9502627-Pyramimonas_sp.AAC.1